MRKYVCLVTDVVIRQHIKDRYQESQEGDQMFAPIERPEDQQLICDNEIEQGGWLIKKGGQSNIETCPEEYITDRRLVVYRQNPE